MQTTGSWVENITIPWAEVCGVDKVLKKVALRKVFNPKRGYGQETPLPKGARQRKRTQSDAQRKSGSDSTEGSVWKWEWGGASSFY